jgi:hypothetical protein
LGCAIGGVLNSPMNAPLVAFTSITKPPMNDVMNRRFPGARRMSAGVVMAVTTRMKAPVVASYSRTSFVFQLPM